MKTFVVIISALMAVSAVWWDSTIRATDGLRIYINSRNEVDVNYVGSEGRTMLTPREQYTTDDDPIGDDDE